MSKQYPTCWKTCNHCKVFAEVKDHSIEDHVRGLKTIWQCHRGDHKNHLISDAHLVEACLWFSPKGGGR